MHTTGQLDWIAVTFQQARNIAQVLPRVIARLPFTETGPGPHGYAKMWKNGIGVVLLTDGKPEMGMHAIMTGETLSQIRELGVADRALCASIVAAQGKASRLDVAVDVYDGELTFDRLVWEYQNGRIKSPARAATVVKNLDTPEGTLYVGRRASNRLLRAYNKGAQVKDERAWLRLELECKKMVARAMVGAVAENDDTRAVINTAIRKFAEFPSVPEYQEALAQGNAKIPAVPRKMTNTYVWLMEVCAPALARYELDNPQDGVFDAFLTCYADARQRQREIRENQRNLTANTPLE